MQKVDLRVKAAFGAFTKFRKATVIFVVSVSMSIFRSSAWNYSALIGQIVTKFGI
jgi:hypothetical protein